MASNYLRLLRLYRTELLPGIKGSIVLDPVKVSVFTESRKYNVMRGTSGILVPGQSVLSVGDEEMHTRPNCTHIEVIARSKPREDDIILCRLAADRVVTMLSVLLTSDIFVDQLYDGWMSDQTRGAYETWFKSSKPIEANLSIVARSLREFAETIVRRSEIDDRFSLMAKLYTRALGLPPGDEQFLWLWTVLEVYPMQGTSNIAPISRELARITGESASSIKARLGLGRLNGARSQLVHDGRLSGDQRTVSDHLWQLDRIIRAIIRDLGGLPYDGSLAL